MLYINGRPIHPLVSFVASVVVIAAMIGLGVLLLPVIGGIMIFVLLCVAALAFYGLYYRWRYGDPFKRAQEQMMNRMREAASGQGFREAAGGASNAAASAAAAEPAVRKGEARTGVRRTTVIEDAVVLEEIRHREGGRKED